MINRSSEEVLAAFRAGAVDVAMAEWPIHVQDADVARHSVDCVAIAPAGHPLASLDEVVDRAWDRLRGNPALDRLFYTASELGDFSLIWLLLGTARGVTLRGGTREAARLALALGAESALVNGVVKSAFRRERPIQSGERPHNLRQPLTSSFPSGHASAAFLAATLLSERSKVKPLWFGLATIVATSRIHVRIHHASDVVLGAGIGLTLGRLVRRVVPLR
jgi:undecaprenyl-diphosphatase